jgi:putative transcriptional regulator
MGRRPGRGWLAFAARLALVAFAPAAFAAGADAPGVFLVAKPTMRDPNFAGTVVLVVETPEGGTVGVIVNRPTERSLASLLPGNPRLTRFTEPLYFGGPVERAGLFALFQAAVSPGPSFRVFDDLHLALDPATVERLLRHPPEQVRLFNGYSGWAPGQLARELQRGDWWIVAADAATVFRKDTSTLWEELAARARAVTARADAPPAAYAASR